MGLALDKNLYFASYSEQTIWSLNLLTRKLDLVIDGKKIWDNHGSDRTHGKEIFLLQVI